MKKLLLLLAFCASSLSAQTITQQPTNTTVQAGQTATFTVTVAGGPCRSLWIINGVGHYGSYSSTPTYSVFNTTVAMSGWSVYVQVYGCTSSPNATSGTVTLFVIPDVVLQSIAIAPLSPVIGIGQTQTFTATGSYSDGSIQDLTATAIWASDTPSVATVAGNVATGLAMGTANISATSGGFTASTPLAVQPLITVAIAASYDDSSIPSVQVVIEQVVTNADGTQTATPVLTLTPDPTTGTANGEFLLYPSMEYRGNVYVSNVLVTQQFYPGALVLAVMPNITQANFSVVFFKTTGLVKSFTSGAN